MKRVSQLHFGRARDTCRLARRGTGARQVGKEPHRAVPRTPALTVMGSCCLAWMPGCLGREVAVVSQECAAMYLITVSASALAAYRTESGSSSTTRHTP